jgi:hypothetical protein
LRCGAEQLVYCDPVDSTKAESTMAGGTPPPDPLPGAGRGVRGAGEGLLALWCVNCGGVLIAGSRSCKTVSRNACIRNHQTTTHRSHTKCKNKGREGGEGGEGGGGGGACVLARELRRYDDRREVGLLRRDRFNNFGA